MKAKEALKSLLLVVGILGAWIVVSRVVLPMFGVPT